MAAVTASGVMAGRMRSVGAVLGVLVLWELAGRLMSSGATSLLPPPTVLVGYVTENMPILLVAMRPTLIEAIAGFALGAGISIFVAAVFLKYRTVEAATSNLLVMLHSLPMLAIIPLLVIWFGIGYTPKIIIAALATFFPVLNGALRGLRSAETGTLELMHLLDASAAQVLFKVRIPASLPYIFAGLKIAAPQAILGATVAEWIGSRSGLGSQILMALLNYNVPLLWACMVICALLAAAGFSLIVLVEYLLIGRRAEPGASGE